MAKVKKVLMGNEAIAWALLAQGATVLTSYPGTPASEILASARKFKAEKGLEVWAEWAVNEKVAFEIALTNSWIGGRSAVMMKQVGLNVALDPLMSAAYAGVKGGFVVVSADDPGPYSSQTEQDSRFLAMFAKIPVLDPATPQEAAEMVRRAFELSERHQIPVMLRPTSWICHGRQGFELEEIVQRRQPISLQKDPAHWAAPPRQRFRLHRELNRKVKEVARANTVKLLLGDEGADLAVIASGVPFAHLHDVIKGMGIEDRVAVYKVDMPFPL
ncbi:MAG: indolepyruvate oxidoreductase, partial [Deltaproteobacteria bacterium]